MVEHHSEASDIGPIYIRPCPHRQIRQSSDIHCDASQKPTFAPVQAVADAISAPTAQAGNFRAGNRAMKFARLVEHSIKTTAAEELGGVGSFCGVIRLGGGGAVRTSSWIGV
jgi:hypothetical protein